MRRIVVAFFLCACVRDKTAAVVSVASPTPERVVRASGTIQSDCRITGSGERRESTANALPFRIYADDAIAWHSLIVTRPEETHVAWRDFPFRADHGRARVAIGGQAHVRFTGWAAPDRIFSTTRRMDSVRGHLWARAGAPIEIIAARDGALFGRVATSFVAPRSLVVEGNCADVRYEPNMPARATRDDPQPAKTTTNRSPSMQLFTSPASATPFTTITVADARALALEVHERSGDFVRVSWSDASIALDAWVFASQTTDDVVSPNAVLRRPDVTLLNAGHLSRAPPVSRGRVMRDTPLFVGETPRELVGAFVERSADVLFDAPLRSTLGDRALVPIVFADAMIEAPEGERLWIDESAIHQ